MGRNATLGRADDRAQALRLDPLDVGVADHRLGVAAQQVQALLSKRDAPIRHRRGGLREARGYERAADLHQVADRDQPQIPLGERVDADVVDVGLGVLPGVGEIAADVAPGARGRILPALFELAHQFRGRLAGRVRGRWILSGFRLFLEQRDLAPDIGVRRPDQLALDRRERQVGDVDDLPAVGDQLPSRPELLPEARRHRREVEVHREVHGRAVDRLLVFEVPRRTLRAVTDDPRRERRVRRGRPSPGRVDRRIGWELDLAGAGLAHELRLTGGAALDGDAGVRVQAGPKRAGGGADPAYQLGGRLALFELKRRVVLLVDTWRRLRPDPDVDEPLAVGGALPGY